MKFIPALSAILITASTWAADTVAWPERIVRGVNTNFQVGEEDISHYARVERLRGAVPGQRHHRREAPLRGP